MRVRSVGENAIAAELMKSRMWSSAMRIMTAPRSASISRILLLPSELICSIEIRGDALPTLVIRIYTGVAELSASITSQSPTRNSNCLNSGAAHDSLSKVLRTQVAD